ncbi:MAG: FRG domain-containing protein [Cyanobacteriota bacterium]|nr:FRG domain-containing protein [Cyanobacteriota bacterium]
MSTYPRFTPETLTTKDEKFPDHPVVAIDSFEEYCTVTNTIVKSWRNHAVERQKGNSPGEDPSSDQYVGEILPWFRGQTNAAHDLTPSVARLSNVHSSTYGDVNTVEEYFQERFIRFARPYLTGIHPQDIVEWNYIMRHHSVPSRLLDWTKGSLIGLFYAVHNLIEERYRNPNPDQEKNNQDCAVWMLEPRRLMEMATSKLFSPEAQDREGEDFQSHKGQAAAGKPIRNIASQDPRVKALRKLYFNDIRGYRDGRWRIIVDGIQETLYDVPGLRDYPLPLIPSHISRRLESHLSRFTLHSLVSSDAEIPGALSKSDRSLIKFAQESFVSDTQWYLVKLIIPSHKREEIARHLRMTGVGDMNFSQDLDGLSKELEIRFRLGANDDHIKGV